MRSSGVTEAIYISSASTSWVETQRRCSNVIPGKSKLYALRFIRPLIIIQYKTLSHHRVLTTLRSIIILPRYRVSPTAESTHHHKLLPSLKCRTPPDRGGKMPQSIKSTLRPSTTATMTASETYLASFRNSTISNLSVSRSSGSVPCKSPNDLCS